MIFAIRNGIRISMLVLLLLVCSGIRAQVSLSLTITDNIITNPFSFEPPKPAPAKGVFKTGANDKGTQLFFYFNATGTAEVGGGGYRVRLIAYKTDGGRDEWFNELTYLIKKDDKFGIVAMNFFNPGQYKIVISDNVNKSNVLATGTFSMIKND